MTIFSILPDYNALLELEPEELAGIVLEYLNAMPENALNRHNFSLNHTVQEYPQQKQEEILKALMEAWVWLEREGLVAPKPGDGGNWVFITRRGKKVKNQEGLASYRSADMLPKRLLHPTIATKVWATFIRGDYDTAIFQSFKEVEVLVRKKCNYPNTLYGTALMRKAFDPQTGPLTDTNLPPSECQAISDLYAGSIGLYKNPSSHREVIIKEVTQAVEIILLASHLLNKIENKLVYLPLKSSVEEVK